MRYIEKVQRYRGSIYYMQIYKIRSYMEENRQREGGEMKLVNLKAAFSTRSESYSWRGRRTNKESRSESSVWEAECGRWNRQRA